MSKIWLDDVREPWKYGRLGWIWVKTAAEAISVLRLGTVTECSLDHDLAWEHYPGSGVDPKQYVVKTGYDVVMFMAEHDIWPKDGTWVHSMNPVGKQRMLEEVWKHYRVRWDSGGTN